MKQTCQLKFVQVCQQRKYPIPTTKDLLLVSVVWEQNSFILLYSVIFAIFINVYDILVAEVFSCVSSACNTVATDSFAGLWRFLM